MDKILTFGLWYLTICMLISDFEKICHHQKKFFSFIIFIKKSDKRCKNELKSSNLDSLTLMNKILVCIVDSKICISETSKIYLMIKKVC